MHGLRHRFFVMLYLSLCGAIYADTSNVTQNKSETFMLPGDIPLEMVWIAPGTFLMGRYPGEQHSLGREAPQHQVTLSQGFWMGKYELTKAQWRAVMATTPWSGKAYVSQSPDSPAVYVSWNDAQAFISALSDLTGKTFRLPTEAEWEYAYRAGTTTRFYWGADPEYTSVSEYAWCRVNSLDAEEGYAHSVGKKCPNAWGLYDMSGNVWEWCDDWYGSYSTEAVTDPHGATAGSGRVVRGGSWHQAAWYCRAAPRSKFIPTNRDNPLGFRLAR